MFFYAGGQINELCPQPQTKTPPTKQKYNNPAMARFNKKYQKYLKIPKYISMRPRTM